MEYVYNEYLKRCELFKNNIELTNPNQKLMEMHFKATIELIDAFRTYDEVNHSLIRKMAKNPFIMSYILLCNDTGVRLNENVIVLEDIIKDSIDGIDTFFMELKLFFIPKFLESRGQMTLSFMNVFCETAVKMSIGSYGLNCYFSGDTIDTNEDLILKFIPLLGNNIPFILGEKIIEEAKNNQALADLVFKVTSKMKSNVNMRSNPFKNRSDDSLTGSEDGYVMKSIRDRSFYGREKKEDEGLLY